MDQERGRLPKEKVQTPQIAKKRGIDKTEYNRICAQFSLLSNEITLFLPCQEGLCTLPEVVRGGMKVVCQRMPLHLYRLVSLQIQNLTPDLRLHADTSTSTYTDLPDGRHSTQTVVCISIVLRETSESDSRPGVENGMK
jgi:hypothetical protein